MDITERKITKIAREAEKLVLCTLREQGVDMVYSIWAGLYAPAATPPATLARLEAACQRALGAAPVIDGFERLATPITFRGQAGFAAFQAAETKKWGEIVTTAGMKEP